MVTIEKYSANIIQKWFDHHSDSNFLRHDNSIILPVTPFEVEISKQRYKEIKDIYVNYEEHGGIIFCKVIYNKGKVVLKAIKVVEIKNVYKPSPDRPGRTKANTYQPDWKEYKKYIAQNFSLDYKSILFPIHFHTHPTKDEKEEIAYYKAYSKLNTSEQDKDIAEQRFIEFDKIKIRYLNAIVTGHEQTHNILIYGADITPLDFLKVKINKVMKKFKKGGDTLSELTTNENGKEVIKAATQLLGAISLGFFYGQLDYYTHLFDDNEYFTTLKEEGATIISIPKRKP